MDQHQSQDADVFVADGVRAKLDGLAPGEFVPAVVRLKQKVDLRSVVAIQNATNKSERRQAVIAHLQQFATQEQSNTIQAMSVLEAEGLVRNVQPMWLVNVICLDVTAEAVEYLSQFSAIEYIIGDAEAPLFLQETAWGVHHINSPEVWRRAAGGFMGSGAVVAVLDSGADLNHPDLAQRFWINSAEDLDSDGRLSLTDKNGLDDDGNGFIDDVVGWDFESADNDPSPNLFESGRARGHGTHVAGIIAGDGSNGVATGVAPGAELMILKISSQRSVWSAMQYALTNGADILNMSIGWTQSLSPDLTTWRDVVDNLTDSGVLVVAGAGSGGRAPLVHAPAPEDITTPGRVPRAFTVAAATAPTEHAWLDPVATFSSVGPISWQSVRGFGDYPFPPGLMKPDVTAPGVNITSTMIGGSYVAKSGTSMAVAHVSGVAALLLEQDPTLLPHELAFQLRETAWRFSDPNDVRGWGRVDALKAVDLRREPFGYDLVIDKPDHLWRTESIWIDNDGDGKPDQPVAGIKNRVYARIRNDGGQAVGNAEMRFYYASAGTMGGRGIDNMSAVLSDSGVFEYIGSYSVPVVGPTRSTQETVTGAVEWFVPHSARNPTHWSIAVDLVSPDPPNAEEADRSNNLAINNFFHVTMVPGQVSTFQFYIHGDPRQIRDAFDLDVVRNHLPLDFEVELSLDEVAADKWVEGMRGFEPVTPVVLAEFPTDVAENVSKSIRLLGERGQLERIALTDGKPIMARMVIRAPEIDSGVYSDRNTSGQYILVNTANDHGIFGGLTLSIGIDRDAAELNNIIYAQK
jgi:serine protease AprX